MIKCFIILERGFEVGTSNRLSAKTLGASVYIRKDASIKDW